MSKLVKGIYGVLVIILLIQPHFVQGHLLFVPSLLLQSLITLIVLTIAFALYYFHQRDIQKKEQENRALQEEVYKAGAKLLESFQHIGQLNTRLPLLYQLTTDLLKVERQTLKGRKHIFQTLLQLAVVSITKADWGILRFIEISKHRTVREFVFTKTSLPEEPISNKQMLDALTTTKGIHSWNGMSIIHSSDAHNFTHCFLILPETNTLIDEQPILQSIVDQAQILYHYINSTSTGVS